MHTAVYVAKNGEEMVMSEGASTHEAAIEDAVSWAKSEGLIGDEFPRVTEEEFRASLRIETEAALTWQAIEDNGGGLHLVVFEGDAAIYYADGYEYGPDHGTLRREIELLKGGEHPVKVRWELPEWIIDGEHDLQEVYASLSVGETNGGVIVADEDGIYYDKMGAAAKKAFGDEYEGWTIRTGFHALELPGQSDDADRIDIEPSGAKYADMIREAIEAEYPGATVEIEYDINATGALPASMQTSVVDPESGDHRPGDYGEGGRIAEHIEDICGRVWESWEWVVYEGE